MREIGTSFFLRRILRRIRPMESFRSLPVPRVKGRHSLNQSVNVNRQLLKGVCSAIVKIAFLVCGMERCCPLPCG